MHHCMPPSKNGWPSFNAWFFHPWCALSGLSKTVNTPEITGQIHKLILEGHRISTKSMAEQLGISRERVESIIHEDLDMRNLYAKWVPQWLYVDEKSQRCHLSEQHLEIFGAIRLISCRDWWPWTKPVYITMTRRQNNSQCKCGIATHTAPKTSKCKNRLEKFLA